VLILHGTKDQIVNYRTSQKLVKGFKNAQLILIKNADHGLSINGDLSQGLKVLADWFEK
jgi:alpha-beta hydrolase superfamily lysophospholipase